MREESFIRKFHKTFRWNVICQYDCGCYNLMDDTNIPTNETEKKACIQMLQSTHGGTGFMHESFHKDDPSKFTRKWFAWANTLFGELIVQTYAPKN